MRVLDKLRLRLRSLLRRKSVERELADELHFHLDQLAVTILVFIEFIDQLNRSILLQFIENKPVTTHVENVDQQE